MHTHAHTHTHTHTCIHVAKLQQNTRCTIENGFIKWRNLNHKQITRAMFTLDSFKCALHNVLYIAQREREGEERGRGKEGKGNEGWEREGRRGREEEEGREEREREQEQE